MGDGLCDGGSVRHDGLIARYLNDLLSHAPYAQTQQSEFRAWSKQFAHWLFCADHLAVRYEISYDGVDIRKLSPGTWGVAPTIQTTQTYAHCNWSVLA